MAEEQTAQVAQAEGSGETTEAVATTTDASTGETTETMYLGKFKSVGALEDAYKNLESNYSKKLGAFEGAPEAYTIPEGFEEGDPLIAMAQEWGAENQLSNKGLESLVTKYREYNETRNKQFLENEMKALGENADRRIGNVKDFINANLGEEALGPLANALNSAASVEAFEKIIAMTKAPSPAEAPAAPAVSAEKLREMRFAKDEFGNRRMSTDPAYRQKVMELEAKLKDGNASYIAS